MVKQTDFWSRPLTWGFEQCKLRELDVSKFDALVMVPALRDDRRDG